MTLVTIYKQISIAMSHQLALPYESKCNRQHGHNYEIEVWVQGLRNKLGMVMDYTDISKIVKNFDHQDLNEWLDYQSTAENFVLLLLDRFEQFMKDEEDLREIQFIVRVAETDSSWAEGQKLIKLVKTEPEKGPGIKEVNTVVTA